MNNGLLLDLGAAKTITQSGIDSYEGLYFRLRTDGDSAIIRDIYPYFAGRAKRGIVVFSGMNDNFLPGLIDDLPWELPPAIFQPGYAFDRLNKLVDNANEAIAKKHPSMEAYERVLIFTSKGKWDGAPPSSLKNNVAAKSMLFIFDNTSAEKPSIPAEYGSDQVLFRQIATTPEEWQTVTAGYWKKYTLPLASYSWLPLPIDDGDSPTPNPTPEPEPGTTTPGAINIIIPENITITVNVKVSGTLNIDKDVI